MYTVYNSGSIVKFNFLGDPGHKKKDRPLPKHMNLLIVSMGWRTEQFDTLSIGTDGNLLQSFHVAGVYKGRIDQFRAETLTPPTQSFRRSAG